MSVICSTDYINYPSVTSGKFGINYATTMVPLCSGWMLYGDVNNNKIQAVNAMYQTIGTSYSLSAAPGDMALDSTNGLLYVAMPGYPYLGIVNLNTSVVSYVLLAGPAVHLAATNTGYVFASLSQVVNPGTEYIDYINGMTASYVAGVTVTFFGNNAFLACNSAGTTLIVGADGCGNCSTYEYSFNTGTYASALLYTGPGAYTTNGQEMEMSADGNHLAWVNGGGNGVAAPNNYSILDLSVSNITNNTGFWTTAPYPRSAGFSPNSANIVTTNGTDLQCWGVASHFISKATWFGASAAGNLRRTRFSGGGNIILGLDVPGSSSTPTTILWETFP